MYRSQMFSCSQAKYSFVIVASQQNNITNISDDSSIITNRRGKKRHRVQDKGDISVRTGDISMRTGDISMRTGEQNKLFHNLRSYFD